MHLDQKLPISDGACTAASVFTTNAKRITTALASGTHARRLSEAGFAADVTACAKLDISQCEPVDTDGIITR